MSSDSTHEVFDGTHEVFDGASDVFDDAPDVFDDAPAVFESTLVRWPGEAAWFFAPVPEEHVPDSAGEFGRVPVVATVDDHSWATSVWRDKQGGWLLAVPKKVLRGKDDGDVVTVAIELDPSRM